MKTQRFYYAEESRKHSRTYGGSTYTMNIYECKANQMKLVAMATACTRGHKGEESEVYSALLECGKIHPAIIAQINKRTDENVKTGQRNHAAYYTWRMGEECGLYIKAL